MSSVAKVVAGSTIFITLFILIPFKIALPAEVYQVLTGGTLHNLFQSIGFFFPVKFFCTCIVVLLSARISGLFFNMISWLYHKFF